VPASAVGFNKRTSIERNSMRALTKALVSVTAAVGITAGGLATAGTAMAATPSAASSAVAASAAATAAYNNLGLTRYQAYGVQCFLNTSIYVDLEVDGYLGKESWKAIQNFLNNNWDQNLVVDGIVGPATIRGLQYFLKNGGWGYTGALDGIAGSGTRAAFARFGQATLEQFCE
jgi:peptidoglycan hydrolase-like protein with peptidoglycan-binding domain